MGGLHIDIYLYIERENKREIDRYVIYIHRYKDMAKAIVREREREEEKETTREERSSCLSPSFLGFFHAEKFYKNAAERKMGNSLKTFPRSSSSVSCGLALSDAMQHITWYIKVHCTRAHSLR